MSDRTVHASYDGMEIVRYDRSGKWYLEPTHERLRRQHIGVKEAARSARWGVENANGVIVRGLPGGYLLDQYEQREEEEDVLENYEPKAVVVIVTEGKYEPTVKGPFPNLFKAEDWANRYEPQPGEVVHVLETEQP